MRGIPLAPHMSPGDLCIITVTTRSSCDSLGRIGPEDFVGEFKGVVEAVDYDNRRIKAKFTDPRLTKNRDLAIRRFDDKEPPYEYRVRPRYRIQGLSMQTGFELGQRCVVQIGHFDENPRLCENPGMTPEEVLECFPIEMVGLWEAKIIFASTKGVDMDGTIYYPVAVLLVDDRLANHENEEVRHWHGLEPPVRYNVYRVNEHIIDGAQQVMRVWETARDALMDSWSTLQKG